MLWSTALCVAATPLDSSGLAIFPEDGMLCAIGISAAPTQVWRERIFILACKPNFDFFKANVLLNVCFFSNTHVSLFRINRQHMAGLHLDG